MPGGEEGEHLIAHLRIAHRRAVLVARGEQHGEDIAVVRPGGAPLGDQAVDQRVHLRLAFEIAAIGEAGQVDVEVHQRDRAKAEEADHRIDARANIARLVREVDIEEGAPDDCQRQVVHGGGEVDRRAGAPAHRAPAPSRSPSSPDTLDPPPVEGGLDEAALRGVERALARQQPLAEHRPSRTDAPCANEAARVASRYWLASGPMNIVKCRPRTWKAKVLP